LNAGDRYEVVNSLPPANRWPDREDESGLRIVPEDVH